MKKCAARFKLFNRRHYKRRVRKLTRGKFIASCEQFGRGALVVNTNAIVQERERNGNPIFYLPAEQIRALEWLHAIQMVCAYDPRWEFVAVLLKRQRESAYRVGVPAAKNKTRLDFGVGKSFR